MEPDFIESDFNETDFSESIFTVIIIISESVNPKRWIRIIESESLKLIIILNRWIESLILKSLDPKSFES